MSNPGDHDAVRAPASGAVGLGSGLPRRSGCWGSWIAWRWGWSPTRANTKWCALASGGVGRQACAAGRCCLRDAAPAAALGAPAQGGRGQCRASRPRSPTRACCQRAALAQTRLRSCGSSARARAAQRTASLPRRRAPRARRGAGAQGRVRGLLLPHCAAPEDRLVPHGQEPADCGHPPLLRPARGAAPLQPPPFPCTTADMPGARLAASVRLPCRRLPPGVRPRSRRRRAQAPAAAPCARPTVPAPGALIGCRGAPANQYPDPNVPYPL